MKPDGRYAGLFVAAAILTWIIGFILTRKWPGGRALSLSGHGASHRQAYLLFATSLSIAGVITYLFFVKWFIPTFHQPFVMYILVAVFACLQIVTAWVPDTTNLKRKVHRFCAYSLAGLMPVELIIIGISSNVGLVARLLVIPVVAYMFVTGYLYLFDERMQKHYLIFQSAYIVGFQLVLLSATVLRK